MNVGKMEDDLETDQLLTEMVSKAFNDSRYVLVAQVIPREIPVEPVTEIKRHELQRQPGLFRVKGVEEEMMDGSVVTFQDLSQLKSQRERIL